MEEKKTRENSGEFISSSNFSQFYQTFPLTNFIKDYEKIKAPIISRQEDLIIDDIVNEFE
jgi:hypothetical protein